MVEISDALARDLLWWLQNTSVPYVTVGERWERQGGNRKEPAMEIARDSMVEELSGAMTHPDAMKDDFDATLDKQLSDMARAFGQVYIKAKKSPPQCHENQGIESEKEKTSHHVVLTVEEAKDFKDYFEFICNRTHIGDSMWGEVHYLRNKIVDALMRIEQVEMSKQSTQCENVSKKDEKIDMTVEEAEDEENE